MFEKDCCKSWKATARVSTHLPLFPRLYYERRFLMDVVIVEAGEEGKMGGDPCGRLPGFTTALLPISSVSFMC